MTTPVIVWLSIAVVGAIGCWRQWRRTVQHIREIKRAKRELERMRTEFDQALERVHAAFDQAVDAAIRAEHEPRPEFVPHEPRCHIAHNGRAYLGW